jgi:hypothetical protein
MTREARLVKERQHRPASPGSRRGACGLGPRQSDAWDVASADAWEGGHCVPELALSAMSGSTTALHWSLTSVLLLLGLTLGAAGCGSLKERTVDPAQTWEYPLRLGDTRTRVHERLGIPTRATEDLDEYYVLGISVWYDSKARIAEFAFAGAAVGIDLLYGHPYPDLWLSDRIILRGLTTQSDETAFRRALGEPGREETYTGLLQKKVRLRVCRWRIDDIEIRAQFVAQDEREDREQVSAGTLVDLFVSPTL